MPQNLLIREMAINSKIEEFQNKCKVKLSGKYIGMDIKYLSQFK